MPNALFSGHTGKRVLPSEQFMGEVISRRSRSGQSRSRSTTFYPGVSSRDLLRGEMRCVHIIQELGRTLFPDSLHKPRWCAGILRVRCSELL